MGNWCVVAPPEVESHLPLDPYHFKRILHRDRVLQLQSAIRCSLLRSQLQRQLLLLPLEPGSDLYGPVSSPNLVILPLSAAAEARRQELPDFNYDLPVLCATKKPAVCLSDHSVYEGEWHQGRRYGRGACYKDGGVLEGYWTGELLHYKGRTIFSDGSSYDGGFDQMRRHGRGVYMSGDGQEIYDGEWEYGVKHGKAKEILKGVIYKGLFCKGEKTGASVQLELPNGDRYEGSMVNGKKHGRGKYKWSNEDEYDGDFVEDRLEGTGRWVRQQDEYAGQLKDGVWQGRGVRRWDIYEYEGEFDEGRMHGEGWLTINGSRRRLFRFHRNERGPELSTETHLPLLPH